MGGKGLVLPAVVGVGDDAGMGDGMQYCSEHPQYGRANPGGICALCLQEKLGRLVSSSSSTKKSCSFGDGCSSYYSAGATASLYSSESLSSPPSSSDSIRPTVVEAASSVYGRDKVATSAANVHRPSISRGVMIPFLYGAHHKKKKATSARGGCSGSCNGGSASRWTMSVAASSSSLSLVSAATSSSSGSSCGDPVFKRSKSVAPRSVGGFPEGCRAAAGAITEEPDMLHSPRKKSFWSFLHLSSHRHRDPGSSSPGSKTKRRGGGGTTATTAPAANSWSHEGSSSVHSSCRKGNGGGGQQPRERKPSVGRLLPEGSEVPLGGLRQPQLLR